MNKRNKIIATGITTLVLVAGGTGLAVAGGGNGEDSQENETAITGAALSQAGAAALDFVGQGTVSDTETGDEESYYEVEVTKDDGSQTDVQLDRSFTVISQEAETGNEANDTE